MDTGLGTRSYLIDPVGLLGYEGIDHLRREVPIPTTKEFIDYELLVGVTPQRRTWRSCARWPVLS